MEGIDIFVDKKYKDNLVATLIANYGETKAKEPFFWKSKGAKIVLSYADRYKTTEEGRAFFLQTDLK